MSHSPTQWLAFLERIAEQADLIAMHFFRSPELKVESKPDLSPVTEADHAIERMARARVREECPELDILGEEQGGPQRSPLRLIVDPIDATRNFARGIPLFATLLAIEETDEVVAGIVSAPALGTRWKAARGAGAFRGNDPIRVSTTKDIESAQVFHSDLLGSAEAPHPPPGALRFMRRTRRARGFGDFYQHVLVAEGGGEIALDPQLQPWDIAPLQVIIEEAGGKATTMDGQRSIYGGSLLTSNGLLHAQALEAIFDRAP